MIISTQNWSPSVPPEDIRNTPVQLLTICGIAVKGVWSGALGEFFTAWAPLEQEQK